MPSGAVLLSRLLLDHEEYSTPLLQPLYIAFLTFFKIILAPLFYIRTLIPGTLLATRAQYKRNLLEAHLLA